MLPAGRLHAVSLTSVSRKLSFDQLLSKIVAIVAIKRLETHSSAPAHGIGLKSNSAAPTAQHPASPGLAQRIKADDRCEREQLAEAPFIAKLKAMASREREDPDGYRRQQREKRTEAAER